MYNKAGVKQEGVLFLFTDNQITSERFLVYLNDLLAARTSRTCTPRTSRTARRAVASKAKATGVPQDNQSCFKYFIQVRRTCTSACASRRSARLPHARDKFPALVNATASTVQPWPEDALTTVGKKFLASLDFGENTLLKDGIEKFMPMSFVTVSQEATRFFAEEGRYVSTTPKTYLELLKLYVKLLGEKKEENKVATARLQNGIDKLRSAAEAVSSLEQDLKIMMLSAEEKREVSEAIATRVNAEREVVAGETEKANVEAAKVAALQNEVQKKKDDAMADLALAEPAIEAAMKSLDKLDKKDLGNCKTMATPPKGVDDVFAAVCVLLAGINKGVIVQKNGKVKDKDRTWDAAKKSLLGNVNGLIDELKGYKPNIDSGDVPKINFAEVRQYLKMEHFDPEVIQKKNSAAAGLCTWVVNIVKYYDIWIDVEPKRIKVQEATEMLDKANGELAIVKEQVAELQAQLDILTEEYNGAEKDKREAVEFAE